MDKTNITALITKVNAIVMYKEDKTASYVKNLMEKFENEYLKLLCEDYGMILHNQDYDKKTGQMKKTHVHFVFRLKKRKRKSTIINDLADAFGVEPLGGVQVDGFVSFEGSFQYLIHKNDPDKAQYDVKDIVTNLDEDEVDLVMQEQTTMIDINRLKDACFKADNITDVIDFLGISVYSRYRNAVLDIYDWCKRNPQKGGEQHAAI